MQSNYRNPLIIFGIVAIVVLSVVAASLVAQNSLAPGNTSAANGPTSSCIPGQLTCYQGTNWTCTNSGGVYQNTGQGDAGAGQCNVGGANVCQSGNTGYGCRCIAACGGGVYRCDIPPSQSGCSQTSTTGSGTTGGGSSSGGATTAGATTGTPATTGGTGTTGANITTGTGTTGGTASQAQRSAPASAPAGHIIDLRLCSGPDNYSVCSKVGESVKLDGKSCTCYHKTNDSNVSLACGCYVPNPPAPVSTPVRPGSTPPVAEVTVRGSCLSSQKDQQIFVSCMPNGMALQKTCKCEGDTCNLGNSSIVTAASIGQTKACGDIPEAPSCTDANSCTTDGKFCRAGYAGSIVDNNNNLCGSGHVYCACATYAE